jgi:hypothetical protein
MTKKKVNSPVAPTCMSEKDWRAEEDAYAIARAAAIKTDPQRMAAAKKAAEKLAQQEEKRVKEKQAEVRSLKRFSNAKIKGK